MKGKMQREKWTGWILDYFLRQNLPELSGWPTQIEANLNVDELGGVLANPETGG